MNSYKKSEIFEMVLFCALLISLSTVWYYAWIKPADEARRKIVHCMEEISEPEYIRCHNQIR